MSEIRLFVGVFVDKSIFSSIYPKIINEFDKVSFGKWVEDYNLHFTMKFIGEVDKSEVSQIKDVLSDLLIEYRSKLVFKGLSVLPKRGQPRVLYADIHTEDNMLSENAVLIDTRLQELGFPREEREFVPHITLLRMKSVHNNFRNSLMKYSDYKFGEMSSYKICLIESKLSPRGPIYKVVE